MSHQNRRKPEADAGAAEPIGVLDPPVAFEPQAGKLRRPRPSAAMFVRALAAGLFGNCCVACGVDAGARGLCLGCLRFARRIEARVARCDGCAEELPGRKRGMRSLDADDAAGARPYATGRRFCERCAIDAPPWSRAISGAAYAPPWDAIELGLKFGGRLANAAALAGLIELGLRARRINLAGWTLLPVPLAPERLARRGYNQADRIARALAAATGARVDNGALSRRLDTPAVSALGRGARARVLAGAFELTPTAHARLAGRRVALVDDVMTTGATLREAARVIAARPRELCVLTALRTPPPES